MNERIDVWDIGTFDPELMAMLNANEQLVCNYLITDRRQFEEGEASDRWMPHASNPHSGSYLAFVESVGRDIMQSRTIRAWHYTRLVEDEVETIRENGIYPGTLDTLRQRLYAQAEAGVFSAADSEALYRASPCHHREQQSGRLGKFWMTSDPVVTDDSGVELLLRNWGGEATYFWLEDKRLERLVARIGRPRILEIDVPISNTNHWYSAGKAVVASYASALGYRTDRGAFDLYSMTPLGATAVLAVHTEGEVSFNAMARGYPPRYPLDRR